LDIELTDELIEEGIARELINRIQNLRKSSGLEITDRIVVALSRAGQIENAVAHFNDYIASQVLATSLQVVDNLSEGEEVELNNQNVKISIKKA
jgi:isoleucyl-tRNA synthetase